MQTYLLYKLLYYRSLKDIIYIGLFKIPSISVKSFDCGLLCIRVIQTEVSNNSQFCFLLGFFFCKDTIAGNTKLANKQHELYIAVMRTFFPQIIPICIGAELSIFIALQQLECNVVALFSNAILIYALIMLCTIFAAFAYNFAFDFYRRPPVISFR